MHEHLGLCCVDDTKRVLPFKVFETELSWPAALGRRRKFCRMLERVLYQSWQATSRTMARTCNVNNSVLESGKVLLPLIK
jgi:hypothetical protein